MEKNLNLPLSDPKKDAFLRSSLIKNLQENEKDKEEKNIPVSIKSLNTNINNFVEELSKVLKPTLPAKELVSTVVKIALEVNFGKNFTLTKGFDKMVEKISNGIIVDPILRRQVLSVASWVLDNDKKSQQKNLVNG